MSAMSPVFATFNRMLRQATGQTLEMPRFATAEAALQPLVRVYGLSDIGALAALLETGRSPDIAAQCVEALLNQETSFFRDATVFEVINRCVLPYFHARRIHRRRLRIWSAGCSAGQEAYSLAMLLAAQESRWIDWSPEILGTDVSPKAVQRARDGRYSQFEIQRGLPVREMVRHFDSDGTMWVARPPLRRHVRFAVARLPLLRGIAPQHDLILCRNLLIYLDSVERAKLIDCLADWLAPDGILILGASETLIGQDRRLVPSMQFRGCYVHNGSDR